jgi:AcrR family transcriptional regulator
MTLLPDRHLAAREASHLHDRPVRVVHTPTLGASLDAIAEEAGYTTGVVYSNFRGKDDLFLAVLEAEARRPELRRQVAEQHERLLDTVGGLLEEWTVRWDVEFKLPARAVVRGVYAISRGMGWRRCWPTSREPPTPSSSRRCSWPTRWA